MGELDQSDKMNAAGKKRDAYRANKKLATLVDEALKKAKGEEKKRLLHWKNFFSLFQTPEHAVKIKEEAKKLESDIQNIKQSQKEGYTDPHTNTFVEATENMMRNIVRTHADEKIRKAAFEAMQQLPYSTLDLYVQLIAKRNAFAYALGFDNFYAYKAKIDENMSLDELFSVFEKLYDKTKSVLVDIQNLEKETPGITKPWNFSYMITGDFTKEEDPYFPFEDALVRWGTSFSAIGADIAGGRMVLDLLDRKGKQNNGFCEWPYTVNYKNNKRIPGEARISCNAVYGQVGEGYAEGHHTLFHEGGHAVHYLNSVQKDVILNHEYPPSSVSWAETQSMFMDSMLGSIEWKTRYANYPFELYERKTKKVGFLAPSHIFSIHAVMEFERRIYETKNLTSEIAVTIAKETYKKFWGLDGESLLLLNVPHIYSWESSAYYHGYGLAELQVCQLREYFYKKYGYIVDNPNIGKEMKKVWKLAASRPSNEFIKIVTGKKISPDAYIRSVMLSNEQKIRLAKERIARLEKVKRYTKPINLNGTITLVHGKKKIADSKQGFEKMAEKYKKWLNTLK
jgi:oligoendopeptidase F